MYATVTPKFTTAGNHLSQVVITIFFKDCFKLTLINSMFSLGRQYKKSILTHLSRHCMGWGRNYSSFGSSND